MKNLKFDYIFHFAAYNHVGDSFKHVTENINSNLFSTINLLDHGPRFKKFITKAFIWSLVFLPAKVTFELIPFFFAIFDK